MLLIRWVDVELRSGVFVKDRRRLDWLLCSFGGASVLAFLQFSLMNLLRLSVFLDVVNAISPTVLLRVSQYLTTAGEETCRNVVFKITLKMRADVRQTISLVWLKQTGQFRPWVGRRGGSRP